jgi:hypothetical protein
LAVGLKGRDILAQGGAFFAEPWVKVHQNEAQP